MFNTEIALLRKIRTVLLTPRTASLKIFLAYFRLNRWWFRRLTVSYDRYKRGEGFWRGIYLGEEKFWRQRTGDEFWHIYSTRSPVRDFYINTLISLGDYESVCEIGCGTGLNLLMLEERRPALKTLVGVDSNPYIVQRGASELLQQAKAKLVVEDGLEFLKATEDDEYDVVFVASVLEGISAREVTKIVRELVRVAAKWVVLFERHRLGTLTTAVSNYNAYDYWDLFARSGVTAESVKVTQIPPHIVDPDANINSTIIVDLRQA